MWCLFSLIFLILLAKKHKWKDSEFDREMNPEYAFRALKLIQLLAPKDVAGKNRVRIGHTHEGGYTMLDDFENISKAYSIGIGEDWSYDSDLSSRGIQVFMFDNTIQPPVLNDQHLKFYKFGVHHESKIEQSLLTLEDMVKLDNNTGEMNMILKMDVEGSEWEVLHNSINLNQFSQIVLELHWFKNLTLAKNDFYLALNALKKLNETHQLIWVHGITAGWVGTTNINFGGVPLVDQIEVCYVRRDSKHNFVDYNTKKKRVNEMNFPYWTETLMWWVEGGSNIDFEGLLNLYKDMIHKRADSVAFDEEKDRSNCT